MSCQSRYIEKKLDSEDWHCRLEMSLDEAMFAFKHDSPDGFSLLTPFKADSDKFAPSSLQFMINLRVDDLDAMVADLEAKGISILARQADDYGKFAWIMDPDGVKLELYQQAGD